MRISIIDDSPEDRLDVKAALLCGSSRRYEFHEAETGDEGVRLVRRLQAAGSPPDCVILDIHLPGADVFETLAAMPREEGRIAVPVVTITGDVRFEHGRALLAAGAQDFVGKGWLTPDSLTRAVDSAMERHALTRELRRREDEARRLEQKLLLAEKLESLGVLAGGIAHDFNNLLVGILGSAGLAMAEIPQESPARVEIEAIQGAAVRAAELTRKLLAYSGRGRIVVGRMSLKHLIEEMRSLLSSAVPENVLLSYQLAPALPTVEGDFGQLRQVVLNLVHNAVDAIGGEGGVIKVGTGLVHADSAYLADAYLDESLKPGDYVFLEVQDTGCGMPAETRGKIFDPFFTTKFVGRGLGLAAVLGILRAHKGAIKVQSEPGQGSRFTVLLPVVMGAPESPASSPAPRSSRARASGTILVVDDDDAIRSVTRRLLEREGYTVLVAVDGVDGVDVFREHQDEINAVVLDLTMPRMSGDEALRRLLEMRPGLKVVLASGYSEQEMSGSRVGDGAAGFIEKPFKPQDLLDKLSAIIPRR